MASPKSSLPAAEPALTVGAVVQWYDNGWRFAKLLSVKRKFGVVSYMGKRKKIALEELKTYVK